MTQIAILTITDQANFQRTEHHSVWDTYENARAKANLVLADLVHRDQHHGLGNTFNVDIQLHDVHTASDL